MSQSFFPITGKRVVPILEIRNDDDITLVQPRKTDGSKKGLKLRMLRFSIGSLLRISMTNIDSEKVIEVRQFSADEISGRSSRA